MPYMLRRRILSGSDLPDDATWKQDLPDSGMVTAFEVRIDCQRHKNRALATICHPLVEAVKRVELIAESTKKIVSLTGMQQDFFNYLDFKRVTPRRHREAEHTGNILDLFLMGGRSLYDREYGFDMSKLGNAFLNYTYDLQEGVDEYFEADKHTVTVYEWVWMGPDAPAFKGYFKTRQVLDYTTTATDALKTLGITPGLPVRRIVVQKKTINKSHAGTWSEIELEVNNGEYSPVRITSAFDWLRQQVVDYGLLNQQIGICYLPADANPHYLPSDFAYYSNVLVAPYGLVLPLASSVVGLIQVPAMACIETAGELQYRAEGFGYQGCLLIGFDHDPDGFDLLDTAGMSALKLILTEAAEGCAGAVALQEVVLY